MEDRKLMKGMGGGLDLSQGTVIVENASVDEESIFGDHSYVGPGSDIIGCNCGKYTFFFGYSRMVYTKMGNFCSIAAMTRVNAEQHPFFDRVTTHNFTYFTGAMYGHGENDHEYLKQRKERSLVIGHDVWIGHGAVIMGNITIGNGAVIGANAVVTHDVEPYQIVAGVPARPLGYRFEREYIDALERIRWWDWEDEDIFSRVEELKDVPGFCIKYDPGI